MKTITIHPGFGKNKHPEEFAPILMQPGEIYAVLGDTGSGKSQFIKDIAQFSNGNTVSGRKVLLDDQLVPFSQRHQLRSGLVAHLHQNMRFVLDLSVAEFIKMHQEVRQSRINLERVLELCNQITSEPVSPDHRLQRLSGGQSRALMIADIALICDSPFVLIDEVENAGIKKNIALKALAGQDKLVIVVTHDPHTALLAHKRILLKHGAVQDIISKSVEESQIYQKLNDLYEYQIQIQTDLKSGKVLSHVHI